MKSLRPTVLALILAMFTSSTAFAGNIGGLRSAGNIGGLRSAGNIGGLRSAGNIGGLRSAGSINITPLTISPERSRLDFDTTISANFGGLIRMLLDAGALL